MRGLMLAVALLVFIPTFGPAEEMNGSQNQKINPHGDQGNCEICHQASEKDLTSWLTFSSTKKKLRKDFNSLCRQCHGVDFGHGVGKVPEMNSADLPMDAEGKIACAITCHNMHTKSKDPGQTHYHLRFPINDLCISCHNQ